jgi:oligoribonuclease NrnB/cAMP/cGMP phosphodiesterase (DHH superfamily)
MISYREQHELYALVDHTARSEGLTVRWYDHHRAYLRELGRVACAGYEIEVRTSEQAPSR